MAVSAIENGDECRKHNIFLSNLWPESFVHKVSIKFAAAKNGQVSRKFAAVKNGQVSIQFAAAKKWSSEQEICCSEKWSS